MKFSLIVVASTALVTVVSFNDVAIADQSRTVGKIYDAITVLDRNVRNPDDRIPTDLIASSVAVAIIPDVTQAGFFFGGRRGTGVISRRGANGTWSNPAFINITGGSIGLQFGAKSSDLVLLFRTPNAVRALLDGSFQLGGNVSGTAGPSSQNPVDPTAASGDILTYSSSSGFFGGVALEGGELGFNDSRNRDFYGQDVTPEQILNDPNLVAPPVVKELQEALMQAER